MDYSLLTLHIIAQDSLDSILVIVSCIVEECSLRINVGAEPSNSTASSPGDRGTHSPYSCSSAALYYSSPTCHIQFLTFITPILDGYHRMQGDSPLHTISHPNQPAIGNGPIKALLDLHPIEVRVF